MAPHDLSHLRRQHDTIGLPTPRGRLRESHLGIHCIDHQIKNILFALDVPIERHGADSEFGSQAANGKGLYPFSIRDLYSRAHNMFPAKGRVLTLFTTWLACPNDP